MGYAFPTLKRGAKNPCAYGALIGRCGMRASVKAHDQWEFLQRSFMTLCNRSLTSVGSS
jgi:hypothetical protein